MRYLHVYFFDYDGCRIAGDTIWASSVAKAIRIGSARQRWNTAAQIRRAVRVEIWSGISRLFSGKPETKGPLTRAKDFRERAEKTRVLAGKMTDPTAKRNLGEIAENYARMAERAEATASF